MDLTFANTRFTRGHQRLADYISKHVEDIPYLVEDDLAQACQVSTSTVSRFWAEIGCKSLKEFKQKVKDEVLMSPTRKLQSAFEKLDGERSAATNVLAAVDYLRQSADRLDEAAFERAAGVLSDAAVIYIYGPGSAVSLSALAEFRLTRFGLRVRTLDKGGHELLESLIHVKRQDAILLFGFVSESPEMAVLLDFARERGCRTLLVTDLLVSGMLEKADVSLYTARGELWEFHSMVAPVALLETLLVAVGKRRERQAVDNGEELHRLRRQYQKWLPKRV